MRITAAALPNRRRAAFRCGIRLADDLFTGRFFSAFLDRVDAFNITEDHRLNIAILFVIEHGSDGGSTFVLFGLFLCFVFFNGVERFVQNLDDAMGGYVFFRQRRRGGFRGGSNDSLRNRGYRLRQNCFRRGRRGVMHGSIGQGVFGGVMNRLFVFFDCVDDVRLGCDWGFGGGRSLPIFLERLTRQNQRNDFFGSRVCL